MVKCWIFEELLQYHYCIQALFCHNCSWWISKSVRVTVSTPPLVFRLFKIRWKKDKNNGVGTGVIELSTPGNIVVTLCSQCYFMYWGVWGIVVLSLDFLMWQWHFISSRIWCFSGKWLEKLGFLRPTQSQRKHKENATSERVGRWHSCTNLYLELDKSGFNMFFQHLLLDIHIFLIISSALCTCVSQILNLSHFFPSFSVGLLNLSTPSLKSTDSTVANSKQIPVVSTKKPRL